MERPDFFDWGILSPEEAAQQKKQAYLDAIKARGTPYDAEIENHQNVQKFLQGAQTQLDNFSQPSQDVPDFNEPDGPIGPPSPDDTKRKEDQLRFLLDAHDQVPTISSRAPTASEIPGDLANMVGTAVNRTVTRPIIDTANALNRSSQDFAHSVDVAMGYGTDEEQQPLNRTMAGAQISHTLLAPKLSIAAETAGEMIKGKTGSETVGKLAGQAIALLAPGGALHQLSDFGPREIPALLNSGWQLVDENGKKLANDALNNISNARITPDQTIGEVAPKFGHYLFDPVGQAYQGLQRGSESAAHAADVAMGYGSDQEQQPFNRFLAAGQAVGTVGAPAASLLASATGGVVQGQTGSEAAGQAAEQAVFAVSPGGAVHTLQELADNPSTIAQIRKALTIGAGLTGAQWSLVNSDGKPLPERAAEAILSGLTASNLTAAGSGLIPTKLPRLNPATSGIVARVGGEERNLTRTGMPLSERSDLNAMFELRSPEEMMQRMADAEPAEISATVPGAPGSGELVARRGGNAKVNKNLDGTPVPIRTLAQRALEWADYRDFYQEFSDGMGQVIGDNVKDPDGVFNEMSNVWGGTASQATPPQNLRRTMAAMIAGREYANIVGRLPRTTDELAQAVKGTIIDGDKVVGRIEPIVKNGLYGDALKKPLTLWNDGVASVYTGPKTATFSALNIQKRAGVRVPLSVQDRWAVRAHGYDSDANNVLSNVLASRYMQAQDILAADQLGWEPNQVQSALWFREKYGGNVKYATLSDGTKVPDGSWAHTADYVKDLIPRFQQVLQDYKGGEALGRGAESDLTHPGNNIGGDFGPFAVNKGTVANSAIADAAYRMNNGDLSNRMAAQALDLHNASGGSTISAYHGDMSGSGKFAVGGYGEPAILDHPPTAEEISQYIKRNSADLADPNHALGTWEDGGQHYLDVSRLFDDQAAAQAAGRAKNQISIAKLEPGGASFINTGGTGQGIVSPSLAKRLPGGSPSFVQSLINPATRQNLLESTFGQGPTRGEGALINASTIGGGAIGATQGDTTEERIKNAAQGAITGRLLGASGVGLGRSLNEAGLGIRSKPRDVMTGGVGSQTEPVSGRFGTNIYTTDHPLVSEQQSFDRFTPPDREIAINERAISDFEGRIRRNEGLYDQRTGEPKGEVDPASFIHPDSRYYWNQIQSLQSENARLQNTEGPGPATTLRNIPSGLQLLDTEAPLPPEEFNSLASVAKDTLGVDLRPEMTGAEVYDALGKAASGPEFSVDPVRLSSSGSMEDFNRAEQVDAKNQRAKDLVNSILSQSGYDGIQYNGENVNRVFAPGERNFVPSTDYAIFPQSADKLGSGHTGRGPMTQIGNAPFGIVNGPSPFELPREQKQVVASAMTSNLDKTAAENPSWVKKIPAVAMSARYTAMLSNIAGGLVDIVSNATNVPKTAGQTLIAAGIESAARVPKAERATTINEMRAFGAPMISGFLDGADKATRVFLEGGNPIREEQPQGLLSGKKGLILEAGQRMRIASDQLISTMMNSVGAHMVAYRQADREGLKFGTPEYNSRVGDIAGQVIAKLNNITEEIQGPNGKMASVETPQVAVQGGISKTGNIDDLAAEALNIARRSVFQQDLGGSAQGLYKGTRGNALQFFIPFLRTTMNVASQGVDLTAGGLGAGLDVARGKAGFGPYAGGNLLTTGTSSVLPASQRIANQVMGLGIAGAGAGLVAAGLMTGGGPSNDQELAALRNEGWQPYSIRAGDKYIPITKLLGPLAYPLAFGASAYEAFGQGEGVDANTLKQFALNVNDNWFQQSGLQSFANLFNVLGAGNRTDTEKAWQKELGGIAGSFVPLSGTLRGITQAFDPTIRDPKTWVQRFETGIPGLSKNVPAKLDPLTKEPLTQPGKSGLWAFSPIQYSQQRPGTERYVGSGGAVQDLRIGRAIDRVTKYRNDPVNNREPSAQEWDLYMQYRNFENPDYKLAQRVAKLQ